RHRPSDHSDTSPSPKPPLPHLRSSTSPSRRCRPSVRPYRAASRAAGWQESKSRPNAGGAPIVHKVPARFGTRPRSKLGPAPAQPQRRPIGETGKNSTARAPAERRKRLREIVDMIMAFPIVRMDVRNENDRGLLVVPRLDKSNTAVCAAVFAIELL